MRRGVRGWAARATRTLRDFIAATFRLICSSTSGERLRSLSDASVRSAVKAGSAASSFEDAGREADSGGLGESIGSFVSEFMSCRLGVLASLSISKFKVKNGGQECPPHTDRDQRPKSDGELGCSPRRMWPAGDAQGSVDWFHNLRIHFYTRIRGAKFIVKNLAHLRRVTKDTPDHGHRDGGGVVLAEEAADDDRGPGGEFPACVGENLRGKIVVAGGDDRKQNGEVGRRNRVCGAGKIDQRVDAPCLQKSRRKLGLHAGFRNFFVPIGGAQNGADGSASNPVSGTFVADGKSPASGAGG